MMKVFKDTKDLNENLRRNNLWVSWKKVEREEDVLATFGAQKTFFFRTYLLKCCINFYKVLVKNSVRGKLYAVIVKLLHPDLYIIESIIYSCSPSTTFLTPHIDTHRLLMWIQSKCFWQEIKMPMRSSCVTFHSFDIHYQHGWEQTLNLSQNMKKIFIKTIFFHPHSMKITLPVQLPLSSSHSPLTHARWKKYLDMFACCLSNVWYEYLFTAHALQMIQNLIKKIVYLKSFSIRNSLETFVIELIFWECILTRYPAITLIQNNWRLLNSWKLTFLFTFFHYRSLGLNLSMIAMVNFNVLDFLPSNE